MKKLFIASVLLICALSVVLSSCVTDTEVSTPESVAESEVPTTFIPHLEDRDYTGKTVRILSVWEQTRFAVTQLAPAELNEEPINDAMYNRNLALKDEYGFTVEGIFTSGIVDQVRNEVSGDTAADHFDLLAVGVHFLTALAAEGYLVDLPTIENSSLKLDEKWWDTYANDSMTINNKLYFATGDILLLDDEATEVTYFNKDIVQELGAEEPYTLVRNKKWTIDKMYEMVKQATREDGDGEMNVTGNDRWGLVGPVNMVYKYVLGGNFPIAQKDDDDIPYLAMGSEANVNHFIKVHEMVNDKVNVAYLERFYAWDDANGHIVYDQFTNGKALFYSDTIAAVSGDAMRNADIRYGIIPMPMADESQENYTTSVSAYSFFANSIPTSTADLSFMSFALEAMAYLGNKTVKPAYYDNTLKNKRFTDDDSPVMLDIIFANRVVDLAILFNWDNAIQYYNSLAVKEAVTITSFIDSKKEAFNTAMQTTIEAFNS